MAKKNPFDTRHAKNVAVYQQMIDAIFFKYAAEMAKLGGSVKNFNASKVFAFADYPATTARVKLLLNRMSTDIERVVVNGVAHEWELADRKNDELCDKVFGPLKDKLTAEQMAKYYKPHDDALEAFLQRRTAGMNLSDRVWNYTNQFKAEIELALDLGIRDGQDAASMTKSVRQYLKYPDKLFRRVRNEDGKLGLSKAARAFHPGRGVYRSSFKNARRLTSTETNIAYRSADYARWQDLDFVVGIHIEPSKTNHTAPDICDDLAGDYPKTFKFVGWHPHCRCHATSILKTQDELIADINDGVDRGSVNAVKDVPRDFKDYIDTNAQRIARTPDLPYFLRDNGHRDADGHYVLKDFGKKAVDRTPSALDIARKRHDERTPEQAKAIRDAWTAREHKHDLIRTTAANIARVGADYADVDVAGLKAAIRDGNLERMEQETKLVAKQLAVVRRQERALSSLIPNAHDLHKSYSMAELQTAYSELDDVMNRWLRKYGYASLDAAPLEHLKNKLTFELTSPSVDYANSKLIDKAVNAKIALVERKIEWTGLVARTQDLITYKTKSAAYKDIVADIDDAIKRNDMDALRRSIGKAETKKAELIAKQMKRSGGDAAGALNPEYKGGVVGQDIRAKFDARNIVPTDAFDRKPRFTNDAARMQGFDSPAKLVTPTEFAVLEQNSGDVFYRTINGTTFRGKQMTGAEFARQIYEADRLELNGGGGRVYGDGMYVATSAWDGRKLNALTKDLRENAFYDSSVYGNHGAKTLGLTWTRKPNVIKETELDQLWRQLSPEEQLKYGKHMNTYGCVLGYDAMYCDGVNYMVIWNRSIMAVKNQ